MEELIKKVKVALRVTTNDEDINNEIKDLVDEALADLKSFTNCECNPSDPLIVSAVKAYSKAHYGYDEKADRWMEVYDSLKEDIGVAFYEE